jgi:VWFA-related protein
LIACSVYWLALADAAAQDQSKPAPGDDVIRVNTALVQTDVTVLDKNGSFVNGLGRDQFALKIDGKRREISFFEQVRAGSRNEEAQLAAARGMSTPASATKESGGPVPLDRGRTIFFFVDDMHMDAASVAAVRKLLLHFTDHDLGQNDQAAIVSASGQIGFLQQLSNNKTVLRTALERIKPRQGLLHDLERPPMSEYQALQIDRGDIDTFSYFVDEYVKNNMVPRSVAEEDVRLRARQILQQAGELTRRTLSSLENLMRSAAPLDGRKVLFLLTDGFFIDVNNSDTIERVRSLITRAGRSGTVIYSIDSRGLIAGTTDASSDVAFDLSGRLSRGGMGEIGASQDAMNALARDTGGRAYFNNNSLSTSVAAALKESSIYYLLAWRPETDEQRNHKYRRIEVSVIGHPDLIVRFRNGYGELETTEANGGKSKSDANAKPTTPLDDLQTALRSPVVRNDFPISATLNFLNLIDQGSVLAAGIKIATGSVVLEPGAAGVPQAIVDLACIVLDDQGKVVNSFEQRFTIKAKTSDPKAVPPDYIFYNQYLSIKPGLYQVRFAALDEKQRRAGTLSQWIEVPDLSSKGLTLSSLIVGERKAVAESQAPEQDAAKAAPGKSLLGDAVLNIDHRLTRSSHLRFLTFVYNASSTPNHASDNTTNLAGTGSSNRTDQGPDLAVQVQVFRDNQPVITTPVHKIGLEGVTDLARLPYAAEVSMAELQPGHYVLRVTVIDRLAKSSASQEYNFQVD